MKKLISMMKLSKDRMDNQLPLSEVNKYLDAYKLAGANTVDISTCIGHPNFESYTTLLMNACHDKGLGVTLRSAHVNMEGLYGYPKLVGGNRKPPQFWIDEAVNALKQLPWAVGDVEAIYPERTEGIFSDNTAFLAISSPNDYANFFISLHTALKAALPAGVITGMSANNKTEVLGDNGNDMWIPQSLFDYVGVCVIDHYVDGDPAKFEADIRAVKAKRNKPVYVQEGAPSRFDTPTRAQADAYYAVCKKLADEGILVGYGAWGGWGGNPESVINSSFGLADAGLSLQAWWNQVPNPTHEPTPNPTHEPTPDPIPPPPIPPTPTPNPTVDLSEVLTKLDALQASIDTEFRSAELVDKIRDIVEGAGTASAKYKLIKNIL